MRSKSFLHARPLREVFLALPGQFEANREMVRGIYDYALPESRWAMFHVVQSAKAITNIGKLRTASGLIGLLGRTDLAEAAADLSIPVVNIHDGDVFCDLPQVGGDARRLGAFAADCLYDTRAEHFAYYGLKGENFSDAREAGFCERLAELGQTKVEVFHRNQEALRSSEHFGERNPAIEWLRACPKPIAIYCLSDTFAHELLGSCLQADIPIPQQVMVLGSDDDPFWTLGAHPPLSSIQQPRREIGRQAARMLQRLMRGQTLTTPVVRLHQPELIERQSTLRQHAADPVVEKALHYMQSHAREGVPVTAVAKVAGCSTRALELRFRKSLGRSPGNELKRIRLAIVKQHLREEDMTLEAIAEHCHFSSGIYLSQFFKRETGITPGAYRKAFRR